MATWRPSCRHAAATATWWRMQEEHWLQISEVSQALEIPERSLRRYLDLHGRYLTVKKRGRRRTISSTSLYILERIRDLYAAGKSCQEVEDAMAAMAIPMTVEIAEIKSDKDLIALPVATIMAKLTEQFFQFHRELEKIHEELHEQRIENENLTRQSNHKLEQMEAERTALLDRLKETERRADWSQERLNRIPGWIRRWLRAG